VSALQDLGPRTTPARRVAWRSGAFLLMAMGVVSIALGLGGSITAGGGLLLIPLGIPPLVAGWAVWRRRRWSRPSGGALALAYAGSVAYVATTPLRGLTPPSGESGAAIDPGSLMIAWIFLVAAILIMAGRDGEPARPAPPLPAR
jgi:hypothetical protein